MVERSVTLGEANELNRTREKRGETGASVFFFVNFSPAL